MDSFKEDIKSIIDWTLKQLDMYSKDAEAAAESEINKIQLKHYMATADRVNAKTGGLLGNPSRMRNR